MKPSPLKETIKVAQILNLPSINSASEETHGLARVVEGAIPWAKRVASLMEEAGIHPTLARAPSCSSRGCTPTVQILVPQEELLAAHALLADQWLQDLDREGTLTEEYRARIRKAWQEAENEPPCPACGHIGPLVDGACGECGLVLA